MYTPSLVVLSTLLLSLAGPSVTALPIAERSLEISLYARESTSSPSSEAGAPSAPANGTVVAAELEGSGPTSTGSSDPSGTTDSTTPRPSDALTPTGSTGGSTTTAIKPTHPHHHHYLWTLPSLNDIIRTMRVSRAAKLAKRKAAREAAKAKSAALVKPGPAGQVAESKTDAPPESTVTDSKTTAKPVTEVSGTDNDDASPSPSSVQRSDAQAALAAAVEAREMGLDTLQERDFYYGEFDEFD